MRKVVTIILALAALLSASAAAVVHRTPVDRSVTKAAVHQMPSPPGDNGKRYF